MVAQTRARTHKCAGADDLRESALPRKRPSATAAQHVVMGQEETLRAVNDAICQSLLAHS